MDPIQQLPAPSASQSKRVYRITWIVCLLVMLSGAPSQPAAAQPAVGPLAGLGTPISLSAGVSDGTLSWGDYDNDGSPDLLATGTTSSGSGKTTLFRNNKGTFAEYSTGMEQVQSSSAAWGDYDNDGYLDVLLTGQVRVQTGSIIGFAGVYHNEAYPAGGRIFILKQTLPHIYQGSGTWGDYNNDGRLDFVLTGTSDGGAPFGKIYRQTSSNTFDSNGTPPVTPLGFSASAWGDFDKNGFNDFVVSGKTAGNVPTTQVYRNNGNGGFSVTSLTGLWNGTINFLDYDADGYLDLLLTGNKGINSSTDLQPATILYHYSSAAGSFSAIPNTTTKLLDFWNGSVAVGDYNNDGYPDLAMGGMTTTDLPNKIYLNSAGSGAFSEASDALPKGAGYILAWGNYDFNYVNGKNNNTLDLTIAGVPEEDPITLEETYYTYIYPNSKPAPTENPAPGIPEMKAACWNGSNRLTFYWGAASDGPTPPNWVTYNLRVGTDATNQNIFSAASDIATGFHRMTEMGNAFTNTSATLLNLTNTTYHWSVQAIDASYVSSAFAPDKAFTLIGSVAVDDTYDSVMDNDTDFRMPVLGNDHKTASGTLDVFRYTNPAHGTLRLDSTTHELLYTPTEGYEGPDSFTYQAVQEDTTFCTSATVHIMVTKVNGNPTDIRLSNTATTLGTIPGTWIGTLSTTDPDSGDTFTYALVSGDGSTDNAAFTIVGNRLYTIVTMANPSYSVRIRSTDSGGLTTEKAFTITAVEADNFLYLPNIQK